MDLSVVVPTLNGRAQLARCLDALSEHAPEAEVVVVNGPSTDGTTGMVRERAEVDVLVEIADRNLNVARNAGIERARGEWIAFVSDEYSIESAWVTALCDAGTHTTDEAGSRLAGVFPDSLVGAGATVTDAVRGIVGLSRRLLTRARTRTRASAADDSNASGGSDESSGSTVELAARDAESTDERATRGEKNERTDGSDGDALDASISADRGDRPDGPPAVVTGPIHRELAGGTTTQFPESRSVAGRSVTYFNPDNVAFRRDALDVTDGFDEYLQVGGARDLAHRLAAQDCVVTWAPGMCVRGEYGADGTGHDRRWGARSLSYRLVKNYGLRPIVLRRVAERVAGGGLSDTRGAVRGDLAPSEWFGAARDVVWGTVLGTLDGFRARWRDRDRHNPNGRSSRADRAIEVYDRR